MAALTGCDGARAAARRRAWADSHRGWPFQRFAATLTFRNGTPWVSLATDQAETGPNRRGAGYLKVPPGKLAGLKSHLQILEISSTANELETYLFVPAIQKHGRALVALAVEIVGNDNEECFFLRDQKRIFLLRHESNIRTSTRHRSEHFRDQRFHRLIIEDRWLAKANPYDRPLSLRLPWRAEC
jgi:hypothetical protein